MHPTLRQVPPRVPRFSIQAVYSSRNRKHWTMVFLAISSKAQRISHLQTFLPGLDRSNISGNTTAYYNNVVLCFIFIHRSVFLLFFLAAAGANTLNPDQLKQASTHQSTTHILVLIVPGKPETGQGRSSKGRPGVWRCGGQSAASLAAAEIGT